VAKGEWSRTTEIINRAAEILEAEHPMTTRQLFYRLASAKVIPNTHKHYKLTSRLMTKARDDGRVSFEWIVDRSRPEYRPRAFDDVNQYADVVKRAYRKDYWYTQPNYTEVWTEKDAIIGSIEPVTEELGIRVRVCRGFMSTTRAHEIATYFQRIDKPITVFYVGDHDPSGRMIEQDLFHRIRVDYHSGWFDLKRLAIFAEDIQAFNLPPLRIKDGDTRASSFRAKYGQECVELDALPPDELRRRIREAVTGLIDQELWDRAIRVEEVELQSIKDTVALWPKAAA
jgi:hypothetical protein